MARAYKITNVQRRDEWKSRFSENGQPDMVNYAIALEGESGWIKLSQKITTRPPEIGQELFGNIEDKRTSNGKIYRKFAKQQQQQQGGSGASEEKVDYIIQMLEELTGRQKTYESTPPVSEAELEDPFAGLGV